MNVGASLSLAAAVDASWKHTPLCELETGRKLEAYATWDQRCSTWSNSR